MTSLRRVPFCVCVAWLRYGRNPTHSAPHIVHVVWNPPRRSWQLGESLSDTAWRGIKIISMAGVPSIVGDGPGAHYERGDRPMPLLLRLFSS